jgi:anti-sigma regulatory factor (Ser/Thr protein kinase)
MCNVATFLTELFIHSYQHTEKNNSTNTNLTFQIVLSITTCEFVVKDKGEDNLIIVSIKYKRTSGGAVRTLHFNRKIGGSIPDSGT